MLPCLDKEGNESGEVVRVVHLGLTRGKALISANGVYIIGVQYYLVVAAGDHSISHVVPLLVPGQLYCLGPLVAPCLGRAVGVEHRSLSRKGLMEGIFKQNQTVV